MRIVKNLTEVKGCPNCSNNILVIRINNIGRPYLFCHDCHEEIYEDEDTCYDVGKAPDDIDDSLMNIEYEVGNLTRYATTQHELEQMERIRNIFDELISVIRRMK